MRTIKVFLSPAPALACAWMLAGMLAASPAVAAGGGGGGSARADGSPAEVALAVTLIEGQRYGEAVELLRPYVQRARNDADAHNWLAYAYRKSGRLPQAFEHYRRALALEPTHRGAHEYIGEAYLQVGQPERADYHLRELARICAAACEEYNDLKAAIASHRVAAATPARAP